MDMERVLELKRRTRELYGKEIYDSIEILEDVVNYDLKEELELYHLLGAIESEEDADRQSELVKAYVKLYQNMKPVEHPKERIYLWKEGNMPQNTEYTENPGYAIKHGPDFKPYMYAIEVDKDVTPKGAMVIVAGGDHGRCVINEGYQSCLDFVEQGYQCFLLLNRVNHSPWSKEESGADVARAIQYIRAHAEKYRIQANQVGYAGFSNGGLTGDNCIRYYSGKQKIRDHFPDYEEDELDAYYGAPDAYCCIYGPRFKMDMNHPDVQDVVDHKVSIYPPTFIAVGREDFAMQNLDHYVQELKAAEVPLEVHTFAGVPHGVAGIKIIDGYEKYPNFNLWIPLADAFMQDVYKKNK